MSTEGRTEDSSGAPDTSTMSAAVLDVARRQLGEVGPAALSLRSIAREIGVVPSALYRYLPGREAILTELIRTGYQRLGEEAREAENAVERSDLEGRWFATWRATRAWSVAHPHEYALLYGTPVVGYRAPQDTVAPATIVVSLLAQIAIDAAGDAPQAPEISRGLLADAGTAAAALPDLGIDGVASPALTLAVIEAWTTLFGAISFELFGHYVGSISAHDEHLDRLARAAAARIGIPLGPDAATPKVGP